MDPQTTWDELLDHLAAGELEEARERADSLLTWLNRGGFPPQLFHRVLPELWDRQFCQILCRQLLNPQQKSSP